MLSAKYDRWRVLQHTYERLKKTCVANISDKMWLKRVFRTTYVKLSFENLKKQKILRFCEIQRHLLVYRPLLVLLKKMNVWHYLSNMIVDASYDMAIKGCERLVYCMRFSWKMLLHKHCEIYTRFCMQKIMKFNYWYAVLKSKGCMSEVN